MKISRKEKSLKIVFYNPVEKEEQEIVLAKPKKVHDVKKWFEKKYNTYCFISYDIIVENVTYDIPDDIALKYRVVVK